MPAAVPLIAAGGSAASSAKGSRAAQQANANATKIQQQALEMAFPPELQAGRVNVSNGANNLVGGFFGDGSGTDLGGEFNDIAPDPNVGNFEKGVPDSVFTRSSRNGFTDIVKQVTDPSGVVFGTPLLPDDTISGININDPLGIGIGGEGGGVEATIGDFEPIPEENRIDFSGEGLGQLGRLAELSNVPVDSRIGELINQQAAGLGVQEQGQTQNLQNFRNQIGNIGEQNQQGLQGLLQQAGGAQQDIQSLLNNNNPDAQNQNGIGQFLDVAGNVARNAGNQSQFTDPLQDVLAQTRNLNSQVVQDSQALINANEEQSRFEEQSAIVELNDQLANRGLGNSSAAIEAITNAKQSFSRQRAQDAAKVQAQAKQQQFQNQLGALNQAGRLASIGGQLQQQGFNTQLRGAGTGGGLLQQGAQNTTSLLNQQRGQSRDIASLLGQLSGNQLNTAQTQFELQNRINSQPFNTRAQELGLLQRGELRAQQNQQQRFKNFADVLGINQNLISQLFGAGITGGSQSANISSAIGAQGSRNAAVQNAASGQALASSLSALNESFNQK